VEQRLRLELDAHGRIRGAADRHLADPVDLRQRCCSTVDAASYSFAGDDVSDVSATIMIGASAGLTLR
jgi:hypothetical protein